jgi:hypothetical protein
MLTVKGKKGEREMPGATPSQQAQDADAPAEPGVVSRDDGDDVTLALALAQAARSVEYVVDLGAGRYGVAVTYGPGQRITGIVLRRAAQPVRSAAVASVVEAHLVVATTAITNVMAPAPQRNERQRLSRDQAPNVSTPPRAPILLQIADNARSALGETLRQLRPKEKWDINITIDDLRDVDTRVAPPAR